MTRINALRNTGTRRSTVFGSNVLNATWGNINALIFAAVLIVCSVTVGCSSEKPKPVTANNQIPVTQPSAQPQAMPAPGTQADAKPAPRKVVHKKPATANYTDKTYGLTFEYPRRYAIETGDAAADLLLSHPAPMNFVQAGGVALAAVELPMTGYTNTDFSSAFFDVSVNKTLTADRCAAFAVPQAKTMKSTPEPVVASTDSAAKPDSTQKSDSSVQAATVSTDQSVPTKSNVSDPNKLMVGDLELLGTEAVSGEGTRQSDSKYFHVFQNGACYEFAMNVTTMASDDGITKHVDRDKVFSRLETILNTVKINAVTPEVTAEAPAPTPAPETPAQ